MNRLKNFIRLKFENFIKKQYKKIRVNECLTLKAGQYSVRKGKKRRCFSYCFFENENQVLQLWFRHHDKDLVTIINQ